MFATNAESVNVWKETEKGVFVFDHTERIRKGTMGSAAIQKLNVGDRVAFKKLTADRYKVGTVIGVDKDDKTVAVRRFFRTYIVQSFEDIVKIGDIK